MEDVKWLSDTEIISHIGKKIKEWRLEANIPQKQLAEKSGLSLFTVQQIERGSNTTVSNLLRVLRTLDRLDLFMIFLAPRQVSPLEFEKMSHLSPRKRAAKTRKQADDKYIDGKTIW